MNNETLFHGIIKWTDFDVRNPKGLITANGAAYDGNRPNELMGRNSSGYSAYTTDEKEKEARERSAQVKESILQLSKYCPELETLEKRMNLGALRRRFEEITGRLMRTREEFDAEMSRPMEGNSNSRTGNLR